METFQLNFLIFVWHAMEVALKPHYHHFRAPNQISTQQAVFDSSVNIIAGQ